MDAEKKYDSKIVAKYLLALAKLKDVTLNVTQVQKLLFIAYGYVLAKHNYAFIDEQPKAWPYGPVFPRTRKISYSDDYQISDDELAEISKDHIVTEALQGIIDSFSMYSASQLSAWSHSDDTPWSKVIEKQKNSYNTPIPNDLIKPYFSDRLVK